MGKIRTSTIGRDGIKHETVVRTNQFDEFVIKIAGYFGRDQQWRVIHFIEKLKLKK